MKLKRLHEAATPGEWLTPHYSMGSVSCDCKYILSEYYFGAIAEIHVNNGLKVGEGGNDSPPESEAKANGELITYLRHLAPAIIKLVEAARVATTFEEMSVGSWLDLKNALKPFEEQ